MFRIVPGQVSCFLDSCGRSVVRQGCLFTGRGFVNMLKNAPFGVQQRRWKMMLIGGARRHAANTNRNF
ncbi:MAG: hypothetical protein AUG75_04465 [Cyanobacteria bacterium 13_1_20CM_4_61_6]|nr:MAG: hypothetical protein AUG75_04465 [Cyanobacteria bacterium 13_1_20CM_4_61_6]